VKFLRKNQAKLYKVLVSFTRFMNNLWYDIFGCFGFAQNT